MPILKVQLHNYKVHKDLKLDPNGESFFIIGDSGEGKSTLIEWILAAFAQGPFPTDPLSDGAEDGFAALEYEHSNGIIYTIKRKFVKGKPLRRFEVISSSGGKMSQEEFLTDVLKSAFDNKFDYDRYFNKANSTTARMEYLIKAFGGDKVFENNKTISEKIKQRAVVGGQKLLQKTLFTEDFPLDGDTLESTYKTYIKPASIDDADTSKQVFLRGNLVDTESLQAEVQLYNDTIEKKAKWQESLDTLDARQVEIKKLIATLKKEAKLLESERPVMVQAIEELNQDYYNDLVVAEEELKAGLIKNEQVYQQAEVVYRNAVQEVINFNNTRELFLRALKAFQEHTRLEEEWNGIDQEILDLKEENKNLFIQGIPIPELTIEFNDKGEAIPMYKGREFKLGNLSTGESLEITSRIQDALNPGGNNFIVLPEAQSMGSKIDEVMAYCKDRQIQAIVEMTKRDEKFKIVVTDDARKV